MKFYNLYNEIISNYDFLLDKMMKVDILHIDYSIISKKYQNNDIRKKHIDNIKKQVSNIINKNNNKKYYDLLLTYLKYPNYDMKLKIDYNKATIDDAIFICKMEEKFDLLCDNYKKGKILALKTIRLIINDVYKVLFEEVELDSNDYLTHFTKLYNSLGNTNDKEDLVIINLLPSLAIYKSIYSHNSIKVPGINNDFLSYFLNNNLITITDDFVYEQLINDRYNLSNNNSWITKGYINLDNRTKSLKK